MAERRKSLIWQSIVLAGVLLILGYVTAYFTLSDLTTYTSPTTGETIVARRLRSESAYELFRPLSWIEYKVSGRAVGYIDPPTDLPAGVTWLGDPPA
jgi:hypothetical protein